MTLEMLVSAALMDYNPTEQAYILKAIEEDTLPNSKRLHDGVMKVMEAFDAYEPTVEGYAGFKIDRNSVAKKKAEYKDDRNVGRVVNAGGDSMLITGKKADGRYIVVGKKGEKSARDAADLGVTKKEEVVGIDIDDLHQQMLEGLKQARANVGASKCWDGYKAKGTKKKGGKEVPNCVKEEDMEEGYKGKHGQSDKEYADSRSPGGKMVSGDSKMSGAEYTHGRRVKAANPGMQPDVGGKTKPKSQGKMDKGSRADLAYRKANLKKEETEVSEGVYGADSSMRKAAAKERAAEKKAGSKAKSPGRLGPSAGKSYADHEAHSIKAHDKITKKTKPSVLGMTSEEASMSPQELMLQKKKARIDKMIAMKRQQGLAKQKAGDAQPAKAMGEATEDSLRDRRMERGGVDGNVRYDKAPKFAPGPAKKSSGSDKAIDFVRKEITAKYGKGALIDTKKKK